MKPGLAQADAHLTKLLHRAKFDRSQLAIVPDHSRVRAHLYQDHQLTSGVLKIRYFEIDDSYTPHEVEFRLDDDVHALEGTEAALYHDARLLTVMLTESR